MAVPVPGCRTGLAGDQFSHDEVRFVFRASHLVTYNTTELKADASLYVYLRDEE